MRKVVIIGGGFGGIEVARKLSGSDVEVTVIDRHNHLLFQPLIYQVAAGALASGEVAAPLRHLLKRQRNATVLMAEVTDVDVARRQVVLDDGQRLDYDSLVVACGGETAYFGHENWQEVTSGLKTLGDAIALRNRIFAAYEEAERATDATTRQEWLTFVVVGGGPTGAEISGQLAILSRHTMTKDFRRIDPRTARVILLDAGDRVLAAFSEKTSATAAEELNQLGIVVRTQAMVTDIDSTGVSIKVGEQTERIAARTVVWAAGTRTAGIAPTIARTTGARTDQAGRVEVNPDLTVADHPEISIIGDAARLAGPDGDPLPGLATVAIQQGRHVAEALRRGQPGATEPFTYFDKGALAVVGRGRAVCEVRGHRLSGPVAFAMYIAVHLFYLGGVGGRRLTVAINGIASLFGARQSRVIAGELSTAEEPAEAARTTSDA